MPVTSLFGAPVPEPPCRLSAAPTSRISSSTKSSQPAYARVMITAKNFAFHWLLEVFTWDGATGTYSEQLVKTDIGSKTNKWLYNKPCCGQYGVIPQAGNSAVALRGVESHRLTNLVQFGSHLHGVLT